MASALSLVRPAQTSHPSEPAPRELAGESALVERARRGEVDAFERLYHLHAVRPEWGAKGIWTVLVTAMPEAKNGWSIQAVVDVGADGEIAKVSIPREGHTPRVLTDSDVGRGLQERAKAMLAVSAR